MTAEARREQLLDATKEIVLAHGFHDVSIGSVTIRVAMQAARSPVRPASASMMTPAILSMTPPRFPQIAQTHAAVGR